MEYREEEYIQLSGIQHFVFCRRQWALAYLEQQWVENERTADGRIMHRNVHDSSFREKRGDLLIVRGMKVSSARLGLSGECDAVEFRRSPKGVPIFGQEGTYTVTPVEYKRGKPKEDECDIAQLTAQAMCSKRCCAATYRSDFCIMGKHGIVPGWSLRRNCGNEWQILPKRCTSFAGKGIRQRESGRKPAMPVL